MKQVQLGQLDPGRLLTYLLSRLVDAHSIDDATRKSGSERTRPLRSSTTEAGEILTTAELRWPSRYY